MYLRYWKNTFNYKGVSKFSHLLLCVLINFVILILYLICGILIPLEWENTFVDIYYWILLAMVFPTISMIVRVVRRYIYRFKNVN
ncbi:hypothetical protein BU112_07390 [Staphylococcus shinii]|uniref:Uncharacterized protein n=1 Tax=Staphylococcus shinii TaxID=2912228 RepID=A0A418IFJ5_9STAP|nr:hypothetical protein BU112_07390 [Staphylococcus shinii]